ncbi:hypothetical protein Agub_g2156 [Astrephomene gubernaculifera]|uniref:Cation efflux protein cytoplasmic domain-containing protein n=1 Tax=Astrephomene gubernaculifera TaxID=47775 RepID=A0AAD3HHW3_9CHLO|nr:hypothetical protein Agub_g2156 [Astrephomene gubernaculifera]
MAQLAREVILGRTSSCLDVADFTSIAPTRQGSVARAGLPEDTDVEAAAPLLTRASDEAVARAPSPTQEEVDSFSRRVRFGINASWAVNILLLVAKVAAFVLSGSYAVLASAVDSLVDLLSQAVLAIAEYQVSRFDQRFPIGRTRMTELSVLACAGIMFVSTTLVIRESIGGLWDGFHGEIPPLEIGTVLFSTLGVATVCKLALYLYCVVLRKNPIMVALSEDHLNDVMSNVAAIGGAAVAGNFPRYWYVDPIVALIFSLLIIRNWIAICWEQAQKMVGLAAPEEFIETVTFMTQNHHPAVVMLDRVTAYHHGSNMAVEVEVIMPAAMTVRESHDIALALQHKIEALEGVERAFVHVDYERRSVEEHKVERNLKLGEKDIMKPLAGYDAPSPVSRAASQSNGALPAGPQLSGRSTNGQPSGALVAAAVAAPAGAEPASGCTAASGGPASGAGVVPPGMGGRPGTSAAAAGHVQGGQQGASGSAKGCCCSGSGGVVAQRSGNGDGK